MKFQLQEKRAIRAAAEATGREPPSSGKQVSWYVKACTDAAVPKTKAGDTQPSFINSPVHEHGDPYCRLSRNHWLHG